MSNFNKEIGFVAIGQAGGNIGALFEAIGHTVLYINPSIEDLNTLPNAKNKLKLEGADGSAKDRNRAKNAVIENWEEIVAKIDSTFQKTGAQPITAASDIEKPKPDAAEGTAKKRAKVKPANSETAEETETQTDADFQQKYIYLIFSSAGGTGSGASPMLLEYLIANKPDCDFGAITILPDPSESMHAQANAYECIQELEKIDGAGACFILDNSKAKDKMKINSDFVDLFETILTVPGTIDPRGSIDLADLKQTLDTNGNTLIARLNQDQSTTAELLETLKNNIFAPLENNKVVEIMLISMSTNIDIQELKREIGIPVTIYTGYNDKQTVCVLSGLTFPRTRMNGIERSINADKEERQKAREQTAEPLDKVITINEGAKATKAKLTKEQILAKYMKK